MEKTHATEECNELDAKNLLTHYPEEQEATEVGELVGILEANLTIKEVVEEEKYCFSEAEGVAKKDDARVDTELASDITHVLFSDEDNLRKKATKRPTSYLLHWDGNTHISPLY